MTFTKPTVLYLAIIILLFYAGGLYTFASPPGSPYTVADNATDPSCIPGATNCYVNVVSANSGLTATGSNIQLGGTLSQNTVINQGAFTFTLAQTVPSAGTTVTSQGLTQVTGFPGTVTGYIAPSGDAARHITWVTGGSHNILHTLSGSGDPNLLNGGTEISTSYDLANTASGLITLYAFDTPGAHVTRLQVAPSYINFLFNPDSELQLNGSPGTAGYALTSNGPGVAPTWQIIPVSAISVNNRNTLYSGSISAGQGNTALGSGNNVFLGLSAGEFATNVEQSNFIGKYAGQASTDANNSNFIGYTAGYGSPDASSSNFIGKAAGYTAQNASNSNFLGNEAGSGALYSSFSNFFGNQTGKSAPNANNSNFFGYIAGFSAINASNSNFFGQSAGQSATNASNSNFFGFRAGKDASNASNSIFIGTSAGNSDTVDNTANPDDFSILIGKSTSTGGFSNSIALGGSATNTSSNQFMIGSTTRPIDTLVLTGSGGNTCVLDVTVASPSCSSDETLKTNITDLGTNTLENLLKVKTVSYNWKNYPDKGSQIGFLAQDLEQYFPEVVSTAPNGFKTVSYGGMTPILVEAVRELNVKVNALALGQSPATVFDGIKNWLGDAHNGLENLFVKKVTTEELCVRNAQGETCISRDALDKLLQQHVPSSVIPETTPDTVPAAEPIQDVDTSNPAEIAGQ